MPKISCAEHAAKSNFRFIMFPTTNWTMLAMATVNGDAGGMAALEVLCSRYRPAVLKFVRRQGLSQEEAEDATQDFFQTLLRSHFWARAKPAQGRFRNFLCGALVHRLATRARDARRVKRGGGVNISSLDAMQEMDGDLPPVPGEVMHSFDASWAAALLSGALATVEQEYISTDRETRFRVLRKFLPGIGEPPDQASAAEELGISVNSLRIDLLRLRRRMRELLREEIARTVSAPHEVDEEMNHLLAVLLSASKQ